MNILFRCDEYPPMPYGGIGSVVKLVAENLAARGHCVHVIGYYKELNFVQENINNVQVYRYGKLFFRKYPFYLLVRVLTRILHNNDVRNKCEHYLFHHIIQQHIAKHNMQVFEYVDFQDALFHDIHCYLPYRSYSVPSIVRVHGSASFLLDNQNVKLSDVMRHNDMANLLCADSICAVSHFSAQWVSEFIGGARNVDVIYNPIDAIMFHKHIDYPSNVNLLYFGKFVRTKGIYSLLKAFEIVHRIYPKVTLTMIGRGDHIKQEGVIVKDFMPHDKVLEEIDKVYLTILPSYFETFSMAAIEVMARDCALMFTNRASGPELIEDGINGWMIDPDNPIAMADKIIYAIGHPDEVQRIANYGYESCKKRFSTEVIIPQMEMYYNNLISK